MKKYTITAPFLAATEKPRSIEKLLVLPDDVVWAGPQLQMMVLYNPKTHRRIGKVEIKTFEQSSKGE